MKCSVQKLPGGGIVIACGRRRKPPPCGTCRASAELECDGCDKPVCFACGVSPRKGLDFCPTCFAPAFEYFKANTAHSADRNVRRVEFRAWARANPEKFLELSKALTAEAVRRSTP